jgi:hypothetical protein
MQKQTAAEETLELVIHHIGWPFYYIYKADLKIYKKFFYTIIYLCQNNAQRHRRKKQTIKVKIHYKIKANELYKNMNVYQINFFRSLLTGFF